ncbi:MAG: histidine kinase [Peptococcaceae bacterium]|jgi:two-component system sensor histidine kinase DegS|nr:histidine kinase [Peptococcaceae bacterium]MDH7524803.1 histidine kinase [Peptococcaceae bacterium]
MGKLSLEKIISETLQAIEKGKSQIYDIAENTRSESERVKKELQEIQGQIMLTIDQVDNLERVEKAARIRLMEVSRHFDRYSEEEVREAYERARNLQVELALLRERESQLKLRRNELERSLRKLVSTLEKAEGLMTQVGVVLDYLGGNLKVINNELEVVNQRRLLAPRIIQAQEEERKRVAREIHDGPAQSMANVVLRTEVCEKLMETDLAAARKELRELRETVKGSLQDVRRIIFDLRPMTLDDLGLLPALGRYLETLKERHQINIETKFSGQQKRLSSTIEVAVYRVVQEAVQNSIKHAHSSKIVVKLEMEPQSVIVSIKDDGIGFQAEGYLESPRADSYGLLGMKERLDILGGQLSIKSIPGTGTEILAILPLD